MNLGKLTVMAALALLGLVGCGHDCKGACSDFENCPSAYVPAHTDCDKFCDDVDAVADASSCDDERDKLIDCENDAKDKCSTTTCESQTASWSACINQYCVAHPTDSSCTKFSGDIGFSFGEP